MAFQDNRPRDPSYSSTPYANTIVPGKVGPTKLKAGGYWIKEGSHKPHDTKDRTREGMRELAESHLGQSTWQNIARSLTENGDPYEHIAQFRQLVYAEGVYDEHTKVQGFGLTMECQARMWFQNLKPAALYDFDMLLKSFIGAHTKIGIKHNTATDILNFKQGDGESVRECINRFKRYIVRCPESEIPSNERLISCFLEGLCNKELYMHLFAKNHTDLDECYFNAQRMDDNCNLLQKKSGQDPSVFSESSKNVDVQALVDLIIQKLRLDPKLIHPSQSHNPSESHQNPTKWCYFCVNWTDHETQECQRRIRYLREQSCQTSHPEPRTISNAIEVHPGPSTSVQTHTKKECNDKELALVPILPYHVKEELNSEKALMHQPKSTQLDRALHCYKCHGPHGTKDCPLESESDEKGKASYLDWPEVMMYCKGCAIDHLGKHCPHRPGNDVRVERRTFNYIEVIPSPTSLESESEILSLRVVTRVPTKKVATTSEEPALKPKEEPTLKSNVEPGPKPIEEPILQECAPGEKPKKPKRRKRNKSKKANPEKTKERGDSSGTDTSESGSWESIILEMPDGVRREFIVNSSTNPKSAQGGPKSEPKPTDSKGVPFMAITRAQTKLAEDKREDLSQLGSSKAPKSRKSKQKQRKTYTTPQLAPHVAKEGAVPVILDPVEKEQVTVVPHGVDALSSEKETDFGGLVLVDKINETLDSILKAYEKRLMADNAIPPKLKEYPSPIQEKVNPGEASRSH